MSAQPAEAARPLLALRGLSKHFGAVQALVGVDLELRAGQVTALVGDNGAGKSTLIKTVAGIWSPDSGQIVWKGDPIALHSPRDATDLGIAVVYQDLALCDNLDVVANMFLGRELTNRLALDETQMERAAQKTLADLSVTTVRSVRQPVASLSGGQRQAVAVAKAVMAKAQLVIMDEPTAALGVAQTQLVLDITRELAKQGLAVMVVSHNLNHVFAVADRIAVLFHGRLVTEGDSRDFDTQRVVELITTGGGPDAGLLRPTYGPAHPRRASES